LQWVREGPPLKPAWPDQPRTQLFDAGAEPVVLGKTLFLGSAEHDCVTALDTATGGELWRFYTDGPVRYAPAAWQDRVFFTSDDGFLYCVSAARGKLLWKFRGAPADRRVLGNERLISAWPARGAPVVADGTVYFAASIWPFMGTFFHALDATTGKVIWTNDGDGSTYMKQPHNSESFAGIAPQGPLAIVGDRLLIPGGRSVPACYDRKTGKLLVYKLAENNKRGGGPDLVATAGLFFNGGAVFELATQKYLGEFSKQAVVADGHVYAYRDGRCRAYGLAGTAVKLDKKEVGSCPVAGVEVLIKAGGRLYAGGAGHVSAVSFPAEGKPAVTWKADVAGTVTRLVAADDRLFAVTAEGSLYCFGAAPAEAKVYPRLREPLTTGPDAPAQAAAILESSKVRDGYCIAWGVGSGDLIAELARQSNLRIVAVEPDAQKVEALRRRLTVAGLYGQRVAVHAGDPATFPLPPYLASLMVSEAGVEMTPAFLKRAFAALRPYGGVACLHHDGLPQLAAAAGLENARLRSANGLTLLSREGPLPGSAPWTHEHADAANTRVSKDKLVKAPLGLLWFGGPPNDGILPRHSHGPQPQVSGGRLIIEGVDLLRAVDVYTGRLLWETPLPGLGAFYNNLLHQPGANAGGTNYVALPDGIYVAHERQCLRLDPATGKQVAAFRLPVFSKVEGTPAWSYLNVAGDYLVGGTDPLLDPSKLPKVTGAKKGKGAETGDDPEPGRGKKKSGSKKKDDALTKFFKKVTFTNDNLTSSKRLAVLNRHTGEVLWTATARFGFRHNAICIGSGRLYAIDRLSGPEESRLRRRGEIPARPMRLTAFDLKTGKELWQTDADIFGTWLSYSEAHDVLVEAGRVARDIVNDEPKGMRAYRGATGKVLWYQPTYVGPAMIHGDTILKDMTASDLLTGAAKKRADPITGEPVEWVWSRNYGCNTPLASEHLLTFRSGAAGFLDLCNDGGTGNLGGFRSGCTNNLIVADGVLSAQDYTRTCTCSYQNQTSLALIHMPEAEEWTFFGPGVGKGPVRRLGLSFGAPGDRRADNGTLWVEYPSVGGKSPSVPVEMKPDKDKVQWFRRHPLRVTGPLNWVAASGVKGVESVRITLDPKPGKERTFTVRLYFAEPDGLKAGQRLMNVRIQGREVLHEFDIAREAGGADRSLVKEFRGVRASGDLLLRLAPSAGSASATVLCGVEVIEELQPR
jgi:outer membrane protein assembly factor BamB